MAPTTARLPRYLILPLVLSLVIASWLGFMLVHETGHMLAALSSGGEIQHVVLHPLAFSRTDVSPNPHPLFVAWGGPIFGALFLLLPRLVLSLMRIRSYVLDCIAAFCLLANGAYIAFASIDRIGDAGDLLRHGAPPWTLYLFGAATVPFAFLCFHRLGPHFGLTSRATSKDAAIAAVLAASLVAAFMLVTSIQGPGPTHS